jgi:predicted RNase H-like HicB family nuclease
MKLEYAVQVWREDDQCIAHAMPIDVASSGDSPESARQAVDEAIKVFLSTAAGHGTLREVLEDSGYRRIRGEWRAPAWSGVEQRSVLAKV